MKFSNRLLKFLLTLSALFLLVRFALYDGLVVRTYEVTTPLVSSAHTFVLISDLHATFYGENQEVLAAKIAKLAPEAVFLTGDIAHDHRDFDGVDALFSQLNGRFPLYYVTGNHERWLGFTDDIHALMRSYGVTVLDGDCPPVWLADGEILLYGVDDPLFYEEVANYCLDLERTDVSNEVFDLLLAHRPEFYDIYRKYGYDLILSGHAHGGQVRIPFLLNGLYAPNQGYFPELAGGLYADENGQTMIVSRGLMKDDLPRIFNPPEVCVVRILPED